MIYLLIYSIDLIIWNCTPKYLCQREKPGWRPSHCTGNEKGMVIAAALTSLSKCSRGRDVNCARSSSFPSFQLNFQPSVELRSFIWRACLTVLHDATPPTSRRMLAGHWWRRRQTIVRDCRKYGTAEWQTLQQSTIKNSRDKPYQQKHLSYCYEIRSSQDAPSKSPSDMGMGWYGCPTSGYQFIDQCKRSGYPLVPML